MELSTLKPAQGARKNRKRVGRGPGTGNGKTAGKGHKGQKARSGGGVRAGFEGGQNPLYRRLPKRGFTHMKRWPMAVINVDVLEERFDAGTEITSELLQEAGLIKKTTGGVKLLGRGELSKAFTVHAQAASPQAREKIEKAGGKVEIIAAKGGDAGKAASTTAAGATE